MHNVTTIPEGHVTTPNGFSAGAVYAGIKTSVSYTHLTLPTILRV